MYSKRRRYRRVDSETLEKRERRAQTKAEAEAKAAKRPLLFPLKVEDDKPEDDKAE